MKHTYIQTLTIITLQYNNKTRKKIQQKKKIVDNVSAETRNNEKGKTNMLN